MTKDTKLTELRNRRSKLVEDTKKVDLQITERTIEIAWENGEIVRSSDKLTCKDHPNAQFEIIGQIDGSPTWELRIKGRDKKLNIYHCQDCNQNALSTKAYDCPVCGGVVTGQPDTKSYDNIGPLSGSSGVHHVCRICDTVIGETKYRMS